MLSDGRFVVYSHLTGPAGDGEGEDEDESVKVNLAAVPAGAGRTGE